MYLHPLPQMHIRTPRVYRTAIQLWRKVPAQHESSELTTDAPHDQPRAWNAEEGKSRSKEEAPFTKTDPTTARHNENNASSIGLNLSHGSVMVTSASSLLVFGGDDLFREWHDRSWWASMPRT